MSLNAFGPEHSAERQGPALEHRALLDMQFDVSGGVLSLTRGLGEAIDFDAATAQGVFHTNAIAISAHAIRSNRGSACERRRTQQAAAKARPFFIRPIDQANGDRWAPTKFFID